LKCTTHFKIDNDGLWAWSVLLPQF
jgi:hypothetical protein